MLDDEALWLWGSQLQQVQELMEQVIGTSAGDMLQVVTCKHFILQRVLHVVYIIHVDTEPYMYRILEF